MKLRRGASARRGSTRCCVIISLRPRGARIAWHRQQGHHVAIVSASTPYAVSPVAHDLGLGDNYLATRLEVVSGRFTGGVIEPPCYGAGKVTLAQAYSAQHNLDLAASYFYTRQSPRFTVVGSLLEIRSSSTRIAS